MAISGHISDHDLERYHLGQVVDESELARLEEHILACPACAARRGVGAIHRHAAPGHHRGGPRPVSLQTWQDTEDRQDDFLRVLAEEREDQPQLTSETLIVPSATMRPESTT